MKHRAVSSKIKYQHHMIKGLRKFLEQIESWNEIQSILPGRFKSIKSVKEFTFLVQYNTPSGVKCLAKSGSMVQEVFIVTSKPDDFKRRLEEFLKKS